MLPQDSVKSGVAGAEDWLDWVSGPSGRPQSGRVRGTEMQPGIP